MAIHIGVFCYIYIQKLKGLRAHSLTLIATYAEHLSINLNCLLNPSEMITINLPRKRFQNFHGISIHGLINYGCPLDENIYVNG